MFGGQVCAASPTSTARPVIIITYNQIHGHQSDLNHHSANAYISRVQHIHVATSRLLHYWGTITHSSWRSSVMHSFCILFVKLRTVCVMIPATKAPQRTTRALFQQFLRFLCRNIEVPTAHLREELLHIVHCCVFLKRILGPVPEGCT